MESSNDFARAGQPRSGGGHLTNVLFSFDYVVAVCGHAYEHCPVFPGKAKVLHIGFDDLPALTKHLPAGEEKLAVYRRVRDEVRPLIEMFPQALEREEGPDSLG